MRTLGRCVFDGFVDASTIEFFFERASMLGLTGSAIYLGAVWAGRRVQKFLAERFAAGLVYG